MPELTIRQRLSLPVTPELYKEIRHLWMAHSRAEDARDLDGLIATLAADCVYEIPTTGQRWEGHDGARQFYTTFLGAFPDVKFDLDDIVIGPQGVIEIAMLTGTHQGIWAGIEPTGQRLQFQVVIYFPWNAEARKFAGEKIYFDRMGLLANQP